MRPLGLLAACLVVALPPCVSHAGDLDAPVQTAPTLRSEIERGHAAAIDAQNASGPYEYQQALSAVISQNEQGRTLTEAFRMGLSFGAWRHVWKLLSDGAAFSMAGGKPVDERELATIYAGINFKGFCTRRDKLGVTPGQLKELFGRFHYDQARDDAAWTAAAAAGKFEGTYKGE